MAKFLGTGGTFVFNSITMNVLSWKASLEQPDVNTTDVSSGFYTNIGGIQKLTGTAKIQLDHGATEFYNTGAPIGQSASFTLNVGNTGSTITGTARITKWDIENPAEEAVTGEVSFVSNGSFATST